MKRNLAFIIAVIAAAPTFAHANSPAVVAITEPSTISLIAAGVIALGLARRKVR